MKALLIDPEQIQPQTVQVSGTLDSFYRLLRAEFVDNQFCKIGGRCYSILFNGLVEPDEKQTAFDINGKAVARGRIVIANYNKEGAETTLTDKDIEHINKYIVTKESDESLTRWPAVTGIE